MNKKIKELLESRSADWRFPGNVYENFKALYLIAEYEKNLLDGKALGKILASLVSVEEKPGGPYYSKFPSNDKRKRGYIDASTNAIIAEFLSLYGINLPALSEYKKSSISENIHMATLKDICLPQFTPKEEKIMSGIRDCFMKHVSFLPEIMRKPSMQVFEKTICGNADKQMPLISYYFNLALGNKGNKISRSLVKKLGMLNTFFWSAFIIYDDFWDLDEKAEPLFLPIANTFARTHAQFFESALADVCHKDRLKYGSKYFFKNLMEKLDAANMWEIKYCRAEIRESIFYIPEKLPDYADYERKYEPASGHILGPYLILCLLKEGKNLSELSFRDESRNLILYFKHMLIVMQMNDDMHDFEEDMKRGHLSTAVEFFLHVLPTNKRTINLDEEMPEMKKIFWFNVLPKLSDMALQHCKKSRTALLSMKILQNPAPLENIIDGCEKAAKTALTEYKNSMDFLEAYDSI